jgi:tetratricopeptide (TPR) repeat protein
LAQRRNEEPADTLEELASVGERMMQWVGANPAIVLGGAALILVAAGAFGGYRAWSGARAERASAALSAVRAEFVIAMGGSANDTEVAEPANPETARAVRTDFADRYLALAEEWSGTPTGGLALLEAGGLLERLGDSDRGLEVWTEALASVRADSPARGVLQSRIGRAQEDKGRLEDAARSYEAAAAVPGFPLVAAALTDAARAWAEAGKDDEALAAWRRLRADFPEATIPPYVEARLAEIEMRAGGPPQSVASEPAAPAPATP